MRRTIKHTPPVQMDESNSGADALYIYSLSVRTCVLVMKSEQCIGLAIGEGWGYIDKVPVWPE